MKIYLGNIKNIKGYEGHDEAREALEKPLQKLGWDALDRWRDNQGAPIPPEQKQDNPIRAYVALHDEFSKIKPQNYPRQKKRIVWFQKPGNMFPGKKSFHLRQGERWLKTIGLSQGYDAEVYGDIPDARLNKNFSLLKSEVPSVGYFKKTLPEKLHLFEDVYSGNGDGQEYSLVHTDWKNAIESVEPGVHQFFPYTIRCEDGRVRKDYWIFHHTARLFPVDQAASQFTRFEKCPFETDDDYGYVSDPFYSSYLRIEDGVTAKNRLVFKEKIIVGRHLYFNDWMMCFSPEMAAVVEPLLNDRTKMRLFPVLVRDM